MSVRYPTFLHDTNKIEAVARLGFVVVAAGRGERAGQPQDGPKQYRALAGEPVIRRALHALRSWDREAAVIVVIHADDHPLLAEALGHDIDGLTICAGGPSRQASVHMGLQALAAMDDAPSHVLIHDAARPFVTAGLLDRIRETMESDPDCGALPVLPISETLKSVDDGGLVTGTVPREHLFRAQTPQAFPLGTILALHDKAAESGDTRFTDDASLYEWAGLPVRIVDGDSGNIKLTYRSDFEEAERMLTSKDTPVLPDVRVGHGYDTHQLVDGDRVVLCGVEIPHNKRLSGHSDADVGLHALTDALLATIGAGDIGDHFPPSDPQWRGASSDRFLAHAVALVGDAGGTITHCDVTLICEAPKIGPHREKMRETMAGIVGIDSGRVSVKATTNEKIGFVGRDEGIVALATATVVFAGKDWHG